MKKSWRLGLAFALTTAVMWGLLPIALKGLLSSMDVITITWYRFSVSALLALVLYGHRSKDALLSLFSTSTLPLTVLAIIALLCNYFFYITGLHYSTATATQIAIQTAPLILLLGSIVIFKETFSKWQWLGVIAFTFGLFLFFHHRLDTLDNAANSTYLKGVLWVIAAAICWATYGLAQKQIIKKINASALLLLIYIAGTVVFFPMAQPSQVLLLNPLELALLAFVALNTIIAYSSLGLAMTCWDTSRVSAVIGITPLLTLAFVQLLALWQPNYMVTETLDIISWVGAGLLIIGASVAALAKSAN